MIQKNLPLLNIPICSIRADRDNADQDNHRHGPTARRDRAALADRHKRLHHLRAGRRPRFDSPECVFVSRIFGAIPVLLDFLMTMNEISVADPQTNRPSRLWSRCILTPIVALLRYSDTPTRTPNPLALGQKEAASGCRLKIHSPPKGDSGHKLPLPKARIW